jgi:Ran-binding protein 1
MSEAVKPDPSAEVTAQEETKKVTPESTEDKPASSATETVTSAASATATAVKDNMFSMFGGGPKKEKKEDEANDPDEPSGATKKPADVSAAVLLVTLT